jgi:predicted MFS family arabinose efflux permease
VARYGPVRLQVIGTLGLAASFVWMSSAGAGDTYAAAVLGPMLLNGVAAGLTFMPTTVLVLGDVEPEHAGAASGLMQTMQQLGGAVGLAVIASVYAAGAVPGEFLPGAREAFWTSALLAVLATTAALGPARRRAA